MNEEIQRQQVEKLEQEENRRRERELHLQQCGGKIKPTGTILCFVLFCYTPLSVNTAESDIVANLCIYTFEEGR